MVTKEELKKLEKNRAYALIKSNKSFSFIDDIISSYKVKLPNEKPSSQAVKAGLPNMPIYNKLFDVYNWYKRNGVLHDTTFYTLSAFVNVTIDNYYKMFENDVEEEDYDDDN